MKQQNYYKSFIVDATAHEAFECINNVPEWWNANMEGNSQKQNDEFSVRFGDVHYSRQKLVEVVPDKKVVWLVTDSQLNFLEDKQEWTNTKIVFEINSKGNQTEIHFTHIGLVPQAECYLDCTKGWDFYFKGSLFKLLTEGIGTPAINNEVPTF